MSREHILVILVVIEKSWLGYVNGTFFRIYLYLKVCKKNAYWKCQKSVLHYLNGPLLTLLKLITWNGLAFLIGSLWISIIKIDSRKKFRPWNLLWLNFLDSLINFRAIPVNLLVKHGLVTKVIIVKLGYYMYSCK